MLLQNCDDSWGVYDSKYGFSILYYFQAFNYRLDKKSQNKIHYFYHYSSLYFPIYCNQSVFELQLDYEDKEMDPYSVDPDFFKEAVLPVLQSRIPAFERAQVFQIFRSNLSFMNECLPVFCCPLFV